MKSKYMVEGTRGCKISTIIINLYLIDCVYFIFVKRNLLIRIYFYPTCRRAYNYLKFLSSDKGFYLNKSHYSKTLPRLSRRYRTLTPKPLINQNQRATSLERPASKKFKRYNSNFELSPLPPPIIHHASSLQTLLKQEDMRGTPSSGITQKIKNLKYTGQNIFSKKMTALKAKLSDATIPSIEAPKGSNKDKIKNKRSRFRRAVSDSNTMAELLVRSVIQVHSSLDCIVETHDPPPPLKKQASLNESSTENCGKKLKSGSFLSLQDDITEAPSSNASDLSETTTSDEDDSEQKDTAIDFETVSAIVKTVRRLSLIQGSGSETTSIQSMEVLNEQSEIDSNEECNSITTPMEEKNQWQFDTSSISNDRRISFAYGDEDKYTTSQITTIAENEENEETESNIQSNDSSEKKVIFEVGDSNERDDSDSIQWKFDDEKKVGDGNERDDSGSIQWKFEDIPIDYTDKKVLFAFGKNLEADQIPPKAEFEDFDLESSDDEINDNKNNEDLQKSRKIIIPPVMMGASIENKGLVKTAMEMLLLDKVNLMSTYTPPQSPSITSKEKSFNLPPRSNSIDQNRDGSFYPKIAETFQTIRRSSTQSLNHHMKGGLGVKTASFVKESTNEEGDLHRSLLSLQDHNQQRNENVLGAPFAALPVSGGSHRCSSVANSPNGDDVNAKTSRRDSFLAKTESKLKNVLQGPLQLIRGDSKKRKNLKGDGLLGTALENVLMDSVNEILLTSQIKDGDKNEEILTNPQIQNLQTPCELTPNTTPQKFTPDLPDNIEIAEGNAINKMHASFNPFTRIVASPQPDSSRSEHGHQRTESMGAKISQSPAKLHGIASIHRRSSDSDLSITPKGKFIEFRLVLFLENLDDFIFSTYRFYNYFFLLLLVKDSLGKVSILLLGENYCCILVD